MRYFAIRHNPTGRFLPELGKGKGYTHHEPMAQEDAPPRMFTRHSSAANALRFWLKGKMWNSRGQDWEGEYYEDLNIQPQPDRIPEDMEVVEITLNIASLAAAGS